MTYPSTQGPLDSFEVEAEDVRPHDEAGTGDRVVSPGICSECYMYCGLLVEVASGKVVRLRGDPGDPVYRGGICIKGTRAAELASSPQRVLYPLKKVGPRDGGQWERMSWPEALTTVADRLEGIIKAHGPLAVAAYTGYPGTSRCLMATLFTRSLGSPDIIATTPLWCEGPGMVADHVTVGGPITHFAYHDLEATRCVLLWGTNPVASHPPYWKKILEAKARGAKLIVVDPRKTPAAARADAWLPIRPGTDGALALAMINVIINEELYDHHFVARWCYGFEQLEKHVQAYPPDRVARICEVPAPVIVEAARLYATTKPACMFARNGITRKPNATQACRGVTSLVALTGNVDVPGGNLLPKGVAGFLSRGEMVFGKEWRLPAEIEAQALGAQEFPLWSGPKGVGATSHNTLAIQEMLSPESRIKALIVVGNNAILNSPAPHSVLRAFKKTEFILTADMFLTPTTEMADIFLPAATWFEREEIGPEFHSLHISVSNRAVEPPGEAWDDNKIFIELAKLMRQRGLLRYNLVPWDSVEEFNDFRLKGMGMTFQDLKKVVRVPIPIKYRAYEEGGFKTPTGKVELASTLLEQSGHGPLPEHHELPEGPIATPDLLKEYPLILLAPREGYYFNSRGRQTPSIRKVVPEAPVEIHPATARERNIGQGDWVWIETRWGKCKQRAFLTDRIPHNVVSASGYWWYPEKPAPDYGRVESNISEVVPDGPPFDPIEGTPWLVGRLCRISKASD